MVPNIVPNVQNEAHELNLLSVTPRALGWDGTGCEFDSWQRRIYFISHVHRAYDYFGPFGVLWVHMAWHKNCVNKNPGPDNMLNFQYCANCTPGRLKWHLSPAHGITKKWTHTKYIIGFMQRCTRSKLSRECGRWFYAERHLHKRLHCLSINSDRLEIEPIGQ